MVSHSFTVIICTYNREPYLRQCLDALLAQSLSSSRYDIVVVDNNSSDQTALMVETYLDKMQNLRYVFEPTQGLSHARNRGIRESQGTYLFFLDDDALLSSESLSNLEHYLTDHPETTLVGGRAIIKYLIPKPDWVTSKVESWMGRYNHGDTMIPVTAETLRQKRVTHPIGCCFIVKRTLLESMNGFNPNIGRIGKKMLAGEETLISMKALAEGGSIAYLPSVYVDHMIDPAWVDKRFMLNKTYYYGVSDMAVQFLSGKTPMQLLRYFGFRAVFLCKNLVDIILCLLTLNWLKLYEVRLLLNFHLGLFYGLLIRKDMLTYE